MSRGVLYVATGEPYVREVQESAESVKRHHPDLPIALVTDTPGEMSAVDRVIEVESMEGHVGEASLYFDRTPFDHTLALGTDTVVDGDLGGVFDLLDRFHVAAAHAPIRRAPIDPYPVSEVPEAFPEYNRDVFAYRSEPAVKGFLERWNELFESHQADIGTDHDQPALRQALWEADIDLATLTPEYNCTFNTPTYVEGRVRVFHGRNEARDRIVRRLNGSEAQRVAYPVDRAVIVREEPTLGDRIRASLATQGFLGTLAKGIRSILPDS